MRHPHLIPSDLAGSSKDTAVLLVGTAREFGIDQHDIVKAMNGFRISDALMDVLYDEDVVKRPKKTSGNRAAKTKNPGKGSTT